MRCRFGSDAKRGRRSERGAIAVEFAILLPVFLLLVCGICDFGHVYYMKQLVTNASRDGARYGSLWTTNTTTGARIIPNAYTPTISAWITSKYASLLPDDANLQVTPGGDGYTTGSGHDLSVTVTATKHWWVVGSLVPGLGATQAVSSTTWMQVE
jgi:Flp pilus assembly protein TadG